MAEYKDQNYSLRPLDIAVDGDVFIGGNFTQQKADTVISTAQNLTFRDANLKNVAVDPSWAVESCNISQEDLPDPPTDDEIALEQAKTVAKQQALDDYAAQLDDELSVVDSVDALDVTEIQADIASKIMAQPSPVKRLG